MSLVEQSEVLTVQGCLLNFFFQTRAKLKLKLITI